MDVLIHGMVEQENNHQDDYINGEGDPEDRSPG